MKIILSPAKTISKTCERFSSGVEFSNKTNEILKNVPEVLVSKDYCKAFYMYDGMCYKNIKREEFDECDLEYIREHLIIISALYGALKPFDLINPYRLDFLMKTKIQTLLLILQVRNFQKQLKSIFQRIKFWILNFIKKSMKNLKNILQFRKRLEE